jgi:hypothetical protein
LLSGLNISSEQNKTSTWLALKNFLNLKVLTMYNVEICWTPSVMLVKSTERTVQIVQSALLVFSATTNPLGVSDPPATRAPLVISHQNMKAVLATNAQVVCFLT